MSSTTTDVEFWHVPQPGTLWCSREWKEPQTYNYRSADDVRAILAERPAATIHLYGMRENAPLVATLFEASARVGTPRNIRLAAPRYTGVIVTDENGPRLEDSIAREVVSVAREVPGGPSTGGWRLATRHDYTNCQMIASWDRSPLDRVTKLTRSYLEAHPAYLALSFLGDELNVGAAVELLCQIYDPRWWRSARDPDSPLELWRRLGLSRINNFATRFNRDELGESEAVVGTWFSGQQRWLAHKGPYPPQLWPYRRLREQRDSRGQTLPRALLHACRDFVEFVQAVWLTRLYPGRTYGPHTSKLGRKRPSTVQRLKLHPGQYSPQLFVPKLFFRRPDELACWAKHCQQADRGRVV